MATHNQHRNNNYSPQHDHRSVLNKHPNNFPRFWSSDRCQRNFFFIFSFPFRWRTVQPALESINNALFVRTSCKFVFKKKVLLCFQQLNKLVPLFPFLWLMYVLGNDYCVLCTVHVFRSECLHVSVKISTAWNFTERKKVICIWIVFEFLEKKKENELQDVLWRGYFVIFCSVIENKFCSLWDFDR